MDIAEIKKQLRQRCAASRKAAARVCDPAPAQARLVQYIEEIPALETISGYWPMRDEMDPMPALTSLHEQGFRICLPVVRQKGTSLVFRIWHPGAQMVPGAYGEMIPAEETQAEPDALIVPLLAFDQNGHRLGYGGGFYDRTLAELRSRRRAYGIGFAYGAQLVDDLPVGPYDQRLDVIITETATILPR